MSLGRVLLIEDDIKIARIVQRGLVLKEIEVVVAEDGPTGDQAWAAGGFDLVLLDVMLPGINGIELCAKRRAAGDTTPVILLTARGEEEIREQGLVAGATSYISKPFAFAQLVEQVLHLIHRPK